MPEQLMLTGRDLTLADVERVAQGGARVRLSDAARAGVEASRGMVDRAISENLVF